MLSFGFSFESTLCSLALLSSYFDFVNHFPVGTVSADKDDKAVLNVEVFAVKDGQEDNEAEKVGEAQFDIFPRSNPEPDIEADTDNNMYEKSDVSCMLWA